MRSPKPTLVSKILLSLRGYQGNENRMQCQATRVEQNSIRPALQFGIPISGRFSPTFLEAVRISLSRRIAVLLCDGKSQT